MKRSWTQKAAAIAAVLVVLAGAAVAAVTATGQTRGHSHSHAIRSHATSTAQPAAGQRFGRDIRTAATYLGLSGAQLQSDLQSGKTLAQVADTTSGKSSAGLIAALVAEKRAWLAKQAATLTQRVTTEVNRGAGQKLRRHAARVSRRRAKRHHRAAAAAHS
jgi:hypothetical protein